MPNIKPRPNLHAQHHNLDTLERLVFEDFNATPYTSVPFMCLPCYPKMILLTDFFKLHYFLLITMKINLSIEKLCCWEQNKHMNGSLEINHSYFWLGCLLRLATDEKKVPVY